MGVALKRIVVTGASGNVGTAVLRCLAKRANSPEISAIARRTPPARDPYSAATWASIDLADRDAQDRLRPLMAGADAVVHLAWGFQPSHRREYLRRVAVDGTRAVFAAAAEAGVPHVVHMSSGAVYEAGSYGRPIDESWPATGVPHCVYSVDKVAAERALDELSAAPGGPVLTRLRPGFIGQYAAGMGLERYVLPDFVPSAITNHLPVLPIDRSLAIPAVHSDDIATAIDAALERRAGGTFNLASSVPVRAADFVAPFGCGTVPVPWRVLSSVAEAAWRLRVQPVEGGWIELAYTTPMLDCDRAARILDWTPRHDGPAVWKETVAGMRAGVGADSPVLRSRSTREKLATLVERGPIDRRIPS
ncbi:NAD-dependent epimerase/dehydratase family protein [Rhodococcus chondri]|uniref:NAD-dependent epimerase/dehydratase family protein n=1 Tax=Rhodococcus chondri TaxID=3065941 RepID=A0ABU7JWU2_9NOCA|nr:NAD-dependent epimerase/dehydratase family protein [Rhodococcus sp. CC-R104]MEE2034485.1 NAD-dependent epimerase/dehydratase family protein [Rhodococcus sp. CC-R104]